MTDEDERTTPLGLFNYAHSYWRSAVALKQARVKATHPGDPIWFLYFHAMELYLKYYLRLHGKSVANLRDEYGHRMDRLAKGARSFGFQFDDEDREVLSVIASMNPIDVRYIKTGFFRRPTHEALDRTCKSFHHSAAEALMGRGIKIRRYVS